MSKKQAERKRQDRKEKAKRRIEARRKAIRLEAKKDREDSRLKKKYAIKPMPIVRQPNRVFDPANPTMHLYESVENPAKVEVIKSRLEHNMKILEALEEEIAKEEAERQRISAELEIEGAVTLRNKLDTIAERVEKELGTKRTECNSTEEDGGVNSEIN